MCSFSGMFFELILAADVVELSDVSILENDEASEDTMNPELAKVGIVHMAWNGILWNWSMFAASVCS